MPQPQKKRELLTTTVARLEEELRLRQQQLDEEATRNALARAQIGVLGALSEARLGMHRMMAVHLAPAHGAAGPAEADLAAARQSLQRMDELCDAVHRALLAAPPQPARPACGAAASGAPSASGCTASTAESAMGQRRAPSGAGAAGGALGTGASADVLRAPDAYRAPLQSYDCRRVGMGVPLSEMLRRVFAAGKLDMNQDDFLAWWRGRVRELPIVMQQVQCGISSESDLQQMVFEVGTIYGGMFLSKPWMAHLISLDMSTGLPSSPPPGLWEDIARAMEPNHIQAPLLATCWKWLSTTHSALRADYEALTRRAAGSSDPEAAAAAEEGLRRLQLEYRGITGAAFTVCCATVLRCDQVAAIYAISWPYAPMFASVLAAMHPAGGGGGAVAGAGGGAGAPSGGASGGRGPAGSV